MFCATNIVIDCNLLITAYQYNIDKRLLVFIYVKEVLHTICLSRIDYANISILDNMQVNQQKIILHLNALLLFDFARLAIDNFSLLPAFSFLKDTFLSAL